MANYTNWAGMLNVNEVYGSLHNMLISQQVFSNNLKFNEDLINRVDGGLFGDTKTYYSTDCLEVFDWGGDAEATKLLELNRPKTPQVQAITLDTFKQIRLTLDDYLTKRAWMNEGVFSQFTSVMTGWMRDTKKIYDRSLNKVFRGTVETTTGSQEQTITLETVEGDKEATNRLQATGIARGLADIFTLLEDEGRDFNDYSNMRSYEKSDFEVVWNSDYVNKITNVDLPTMYHKELENLDFSKKMPAKYFGIVGGKKAVTSDGATYRMLKPGFVTLVEDGNIHGEDFKKGDTVFLFAGEVIPNNIVIATTSAINIPYYTNDNTIVCKIIHKQDLPYMSAFEAATNFFNGRSLTENKYDTFGHNELTHIHNFPLITVRVK